MLKSSLLFKKSANFMGKKLKNFQDKEREIFRVLFLYEAEHIVKFSNLYQCTFNYEKLFFQTSENYKEPSVFSSLENFMLLELNLLIMTHENTTNVGQKRRDHGYSINQFIPIAIKIKNEIQRCWLLKCAKLILSEAVVR